MSDVLVVEDGGTLVSDDENASVLLVQDGGTLVVTETGIELLEVAEQGPAGVDGLNGAGAIEFPFAYGDATPALVTTIPAGKTVYGVQLFITTPFDGTGAALTFGDAGQADRLMASTENDPTQVGGGTTTPSYKYGAETALRLSITPGGGASQGSGLLVVFIQQ